MIDKFKKQQGHFALSGLVRHVFGIRQIHTGHLYELENGVSLVQVAAYVVQVSQIFKHCHVPNTLVQRVHVVRAGHADIALL